MKVADHLFIDALVSGLWTVFYLDLSNMAQNHVAFCERHVALHERPMLPFISVMLSFMNAMLPF